MAKGLSKSEEIKLLETLKTGNGYFSDMFTEDEITQMQDNINNDFMLLNGINLHTEEEVQKMQANHERVYHQYDKVITEQNGKIDKLMGTINELVDTLLIRGTATFDSDLFHTAIKVKSHSYVIRRKIELSLPLTEYDLEYVAATI